MRTVTQYAVVDPEMCTACKTCIQVCPVTAVHLEKNKGKPKAVIDENGCQACTICVARCPENAIRLEPKSVPVIIGMDISRLSSEETADLCLQAHMYPDQIVCYCHRVQAKEIAAAILAGAKTPEQVAGMTGARTGCGVLCITGVIRLLQAAGLRLDHAPGHQWYGNTVSIWDLSEEVMRKYDKTFYLRRDLKDIGEMFPRGGKNHEIK